MVDIQSSMLFQRNNHLPHTTIEGDTVLLDIQSGKYYGLASTGHRIWTLLEKPHTFDDLCATLLTEYDVERAQCEKDVRSFLDELIQAGLVSHVLDIQ